MQVSTAANLETNDKNTRGLLNVRNIDNPRDGRRMNILLEQVRLGDGWVCKAQLGKHDGNLYLELSGMMLFPLSLNPTCLQHQMPIIAGVWLGGKSMVSESESLGVSPGRNVCSGSRAAVSQ